MIRIPVFGASPRKGRWGWNAADAHREAEFRARGTYLAELSGDMWARGRRTWYELCGGVRDPEGYLRMVELPSEPPAWPELTGTWAPVDVAMDTEQKLRNAAHVWRQSSGLPWTLEVVASAVVVPVTQSTPAKAVAFRSGVEIVTGTFWPLEAGPRQGAEWMWEPSTLVLAIQDAGGSPSEALSAIADLVRNCPGWVTEWALARRSTAGGLAPSESQRKALDVVERFL